MFLICASKKLFLAFFDRLNHNDPSFFLRKVDIRFILIKSWSKLGNSWSCILLSTNFTCKQINHTITTAIKMKVHFIFFPGYILLGSLDMKCYICHNFSRNMENFPALSHFLILVLIKLVYREEILGCEMQSVVVLVVPNLIKAIFQCDDRQVLMYKHYMQC